MEKEFSKLIELARIRAIAMALPEVQEGPPVPVAHRIAAYKVAGKSFLGLEKSWPRMTNGFGRCETSLLGALWWCISCDLSMEGRSQ